MKEHLIWRSKLAAEFPEEPSDPELRSAVEEIHDSPTKISQAAFFNSILPQVYESAQPHLLAQFESHWIKERRDRWETGNSSWIASLMVSVTRITNVLEKNYITLVRSLAVPSRPQDVSTCVCQERSWAKNQTSRINRGKVTAAEREAVRVIVYKAKIVGPWGARFSYIPGEGGVSTPLFWIG